MKNLVFKSEEHIVNISFLGETSELSALIPIIKSIVLFLTRKFKKQQQINPTTNQLLLLEAEPQASLILVGE